MKLVPNMLTEPISPERTQVTHQTVVVLYVSPYKCIYGVSFCTVTSNMEPSSPSSASGSAPSSAFVTVASNTDASTSAALPTAFSIPQPASPSISSEPPTAPTYRAVPEDETRINADLVRVPPSRSPFFAIYLRNCCVARSHSRAMSLIMSACILGMQKGSMRLVVPSVSFSKVFVA